MKKITLMMALAMFSLIGWQTNAQNGGDDCASAVVVTEGSITQTTITDTSGGTNGGDSAWFSYTPAADGTVNINACMGGVDTRLFIFDDCAGAAIANNDDSCPFAPDGTGNAWASEIPELTVTGGTTYLIQWDDRWSLGPFDWSITYTPPPSCPDVENISAQTAPDGSVNLDWDDVVGAAGYNYEVQPQGVTQGTAGALDMGASVTSDAVVATGVLTSGTAYTLYLQSDCGAGVLGNYQNIDFTYILPPANDTCAGIIDLDNETSPLAGTTLGANNDFVGDCLTNVNAPDVFYSISVPDTFILNFEQLNNTYDSEVRIAYGATCPGDVVIVCYDDPDTEFQEWTNDTGADQEVYIIVSAFGTGSGDFNLQYSVIAPPACPDVENISAQTAPDGSVNLDWDDIVDAIGYNYEVQPQGVAQGTAGALETGSSATSDAIVATGVLTEGETYTLYVQSDCDAGDLGNFQTIDFTIVIPPVNDTCAGVIDLDDVTSPQSGTTVGANNNFVGDCLTNPGAPDVLYSITVPNGFTLDFEQTENAYDSEVRIAYGDSCPGDTVIVCYDDPDTEAQQWINATGATQEVYFLISAFGTGSGTFTFTYLLTPPMPTNGGDGCDTAVPVTEGFYFQTQINDADATLNTGDSAWFAYTATGDGTVNINSCLGGADTRVFVLDDCAGVAIADNDDSCAFAADGTGPAFASEIPELDVTMGTTYFIQWDDRWSVDPFDWSITFTPAPTCPDIENFVSANAMQTTADFMWDDVVEATNGYTLTVYAAGDLTTPLGDTPQMLAAGTTMATVTGLMDTTSYDAYIVADCDALGTSVESTVTFSTPPAPPVCGGKFYDTGGPDNDFMNNEDYQVIILPDVAGDVVTASFVFVDNAGGGFDMLTVDIGDGVFQLVPDVAAGDPPVEYISIAADGSLIFNFFSTAVAPNPGWDADITCGPPPTCPDPQNFAVGTITDMTADFTWSEVAEATVGYTLRVFTDGADPMVDVPVYEMTVPSGTLMDTATGLTQGTAYNAYLNADCGPGDLSNLELVNFTTFLTPGPNSSCDTALVITPGMYIGQIVDANPGANNGDSLWYSFTPTEDGTVTVTSCFGDDNDDTRVFMSEGPCDALVPVGDDDDGCDAPNGFSSLITGIPVVTGTEYLIQWDDRWSTTEFDWELIFEGLPCTAPENIVVSNETETGVDVSWDLASTAVQGYQVAVYLAGDFTTPISSPVLSNTTTMYTVTGLDPGTAYDIYVISLCDLSEDPQDIAFSDAIEFNTVLGLENSALVSYVIFPNPASNEINLKAAYTIENISVINVLGQEVMNNRGGNTELTLNISELSSGTYFLKARVNDLDVVERFIKE